MARPTWFVELIKKTFPNRFVVAKLTKLPVVGGLMDRWLSEGDDLIYLPRDRVIPVNQTLAAPESIVLPSQVVEHFIEQANDHWIMNFCICRSAEKCQDYPIELGCLFLGKASLDINPQLGRRVSKEEAREHARRCRDAGLVHLIGRNKLDSVWLGASPREKLLTICNCCPCCCLWRILPYVSPEFGDKVHRLPGVSVRVTERCVGCGTCTQDVCFADAIQLQDGHAVIGAACRGCGRCVDVCPNKAIEVVVDNDQFAADAIERISALVDLS
jgi:NAD-dependent dihydropyrimidine dehydrogenase PreA subunit